MNQRLNYESRSPEGLKALGEVYAYVAKSGLGKALVDLVYLRASQINGCTYCIDTHAKDLLGAGTPARKLLLLTSWREAKPWFTPREQAALAWTEAVTEVATSHVPDDVFQAASTQFDEKELTDLTIAIGLINIYNRIAIGFRRGPAAPPEK